MHTSRPRWIHQKHPPPSSIENAALLYETLLDAYPDTARYVGWAFGHCRRCNATLYAVRACSDDSLILLFCRVCSWHCADVSSRVFRRAVLHQLRHGPPQDRHPLRPLERDIKKHLRSLKRE